MDKREEPSETWLGPGGYFDEAMNGFEYQVAAHMIYEGMTEKGLAIFKAEHERYAADKRNPYNEIEWSDHYSRSMASYGIFTAICGFDYHGPNGCIKFNPQIQKDDFMSAFTAAEAWGSFTQKRTRSKQTNVLNVDFGTLSLKEIKLGVDAKPTSLSLQIDGKEASDLNYNYENGLLSLTFKKERVKSNLKITMV